MGGRGSGGASGATFKTDNANRAAEAIGGKLGIATVQAIYASGNGDFASVADVRDALERQGFSASESASAIRDLARAGSGGYVVPVANLKSLSQREKDRSVSIGGEDNHAVRINP